MKKQDKAKIKRIKEKTQEIHLDTETHSFVPTE